MVMYSIPIFNSWPKDEVGKFMLDDEDIQLQEKIGQGSYGIVYTAVVKNVE